MANGQRAKGGREAKLEPLSIIRTSFTDGRENLTQATPFPLKMAGKSLSQMGIPTQLLHIFHARNLHTAKDVLMRTELELLELLEMHVNDLRLAVATICQAVAPRCRTLRELWDQRAADEPARGHLATALQGLDEALCGGIPLGVVTEVAAAAGMGKTQLCFQLSVLVAMAAIREGLDGCVLYVDSEHTFRAQRLLQIAQARWPDLCSSKETGMELISRVMVVQPETTAELVSKLQTLQQEVDLNSVRLLVVDGVAALMQADFGLDRIAERQKVVGQVASTLKSLAERLRIPVVVTNQVRMQRAGQGDVPTFEEAISCGDGGDGSPDMQQAPALGTRWAHAVNIRLLLEMHLGQRSVKIAKCPYAPVVRFPYTLTSAGVQQQVLN